MVNFLSLSPYSSALSTYPRTAPLHGGSSAGKSDLCCGRSLDIVGRPGLHQSGPMSICLSGCPSPGPRKNDLTIYWALGPFVRSFTLLVDPGDIYPPQRPRRRRSRWSSRWSPTPGKYGHRCPFSCNISSSPFSSLSCHYSCHYH
jgi:hypothetical protein